MLLVVSLPPPWNKAILGTAIYITLTDHYSSEVAVVIIIYPDVSTQSAWLAKPAILTWLCHMRSLSLRSEVQQCKGSPLLCKSTGVFSSSWVAWYALLYHEHILQPIRPPDNYQGVSEDRMKQHRPQLWLPPLLQKAVGKAKTCPTWLLLHQASTKYINMPYLLSHASNSWPRPHTQLVLSSKFSSDHWITSCANRKDII